MSSRLASLALIEAYTNAEVREALDSLFRVGITMAELREHIAVADSTRCDPAVRVSECPSCRRGSAKALPAAIVRPLRRTLWQRIRDLW